MRYVPHSTTESLPKAPHLNVNVVNFRSQHRPISCGIQRFSKSNGNSNFDGLIGI